MAVHQDRKTRSRRGMRRAHDKLAKPAVTIDQTTGFPHLRHHMTEAGVYRGKQITKVAAIKEEAAE